MWRFGCSGGGPAGGGMNLCGRGVAAMANAGAVVPLPQGADSKTNIRLHVFAPVVLQSYSVATSPFVLPERGRKR